MKLLRILETKVVEKKHFGMIREVSEKVKKQLLTKFSTQTQDSPEVIVKLIDAFEIYKNGLPADKRDLNRYTYDELKSLISSKEQSKQEDSLFTMFKKKEKSIDRNELKKYIRRFLDIQSHLPNKYKNIEDLDYLSLVELVNKNYNNVLQKKLTEKFTKENPDITQTILSYYLNNYFQNLDAFPTQGKRVGDMTFAEFEHLIDGVLADIGGETDVDSKKDYNAVDIIYDENNLKIFAPKTKDQCMKLRNGRTWCTSREGGSNLYYNYRLDNERTLYYIIDEDKPFKDLDFAVVILVDPRGGMALADGSNSGRYSGHSNIPWDEIVGKIPKLKGLKDLLQPKPLTNEEKDLIRKVRGTKVGANPMESFDSPEEVELWLEIVTPTLKDEQYVNLTPELKKKYIALGMTLTSQMLSGSEPEVLSYYINKKLDVIKNTNLKNLDADDIALLNLPSMKKVKEELKQKFSTQFTSGSNNKEVDIVFPSGETSKFIALYGIDSLFDNLPLDITDFSFENRSETKIILNIPSSISKFQNLEILKLDNCVDKVPEEICQLKNLNFLTLNGNKNLMTIPECIGNMESLTFLSLKGCDNVEVPMSVKEKADDFGDGMWNFS